MWNWHRVAALVRRLGLIKLSYFAVFGLDFVRRWPANRRYARAHPDVAAPPALLRFETNYDTNLERFIEDGRSHARSLYEFVEPHLPAGPIKICEWGCGAARLIRHMPTIDPARPIQASGTDYSAKLIAWCRANIPEANFELNDLEPPLPFPEGEFDWIYNSSVLTHLSAELQQAWVAENLRVLKPGGLALFTVHGNAHKDRLVGAERSQYEHDGVVVRGGIGDGEPWFTTYNNPAFVPQTLLRGLEIVDTRLYPEGHQPPRQDIWLVRKSLPG